MKSCRTRLPVLRRWMRRGIPRSRHSSSARGLSDVASGGAPRPGVQPTRRAVGDAGRHREPALRDGVLAEREPAGTTAADRCRHYAGGVADGRGCGRECRAERAVGECGRQYVGRSSDPMVYLPYRQQPPSVSPSFTYVLVRPRAPSAGLAMTVQRELQAANPDLPIAVTPLGELVTATYRESAIDTLVVLSRLDRAAAGVSRIVAVIAHAVSQRRRRWHGSRSVPARTTSSRSSSSKEPAGGCWADGRLGRLFGVTHL